MVPTGLVSSDKVTRYFTHEEKTDLDIKTSVNKIGEIINLSQILNSIMWDRLAHGCKFEEILELYCDISQLDVMSNIEIDKAKKAFSIDNEYELNVLRNKYSIKDEFGRETKPDFFKHLAMQKGYMSYNKVILEDGSTKNLSSKNYKKHKTSMDYLQKSINLLKCRNNIKKEFIKFTDVLDSSKYIPSSVVRAQVLSVFEIIDIQNKKINNIWASTNDLDYRVKMMMSIEAKNETIKQLNKIKFSYSTAYNILSALENEEYSQVMSKLLFILLSLSNKSFYDVLIQSKKNIEYIEENASGEIEIYGRKFAKTYKNSL